MNYIAKSIIGIKIHTLEEVVELNKGMKSFVNMLCLENGASYIGRLDSAKYLLKRRANLPIYVKEDILLFPTESIRNIGCKMVNCKQISHIIKEQNKCTIIFKDGELLPVEQSFLKINNQVKMSETFSLLLENEKKVFTLDLYK